MQSGCLLLTKETACIELEEQCCQLDRCEYISASNTENQDIKFCADRRHRRDERKCSDFVGTTEDCPADICFVKDFTFFKTCEPKEEEDQTTTVTTVTTVTAEKEDTTIVTTTVAKTTSKEATTTIKVDIVQTIYQLYYLELESRVDNKSICFHNTVAQLVK